MKKFNDLVNATMVPESRERAREKTAKLLSALGADIAAIRKRHARYAATSDATGFVTQGHADMDAILK